jgi:thymidylate synthase (FAD)
MLDYKLGDYIPVHEYGYVALIDKMGSDEDVVDAARISYDRRGKSEDRALIRYLLRHRHSSPLEMAVLKFEVKMPIFVARQFVRHRTASINEVSARYTEPPEEMFVPAEFSIQSTDNKQGRGDVLPENTQQVLRDVMRESNSETYDTYKWLLDMDVARETAREVLNLNIYTKFIWKMDLHNLMHFLDLRLDPHAQQEIRDYAEIIERIVAQFFPLCHEAFVDYVRDAYTCSRMEVEVLRHMLWQARNLHKKSEEMKATTNEIDRVCEHTGMSKREITEFKQRFLK